MKKMGIVNNNKTWKIERMGGMQEIMLRIQKECF